VLLPNTVSMLHGSLVTHVTIITKVGASYIDHINGWYAGGRLFIANVTRLSSPLIFWGECLGTRL